MNFKMKAAVAAIALTASMSANAAMTNAASGDSSLILTLLDNTNNISATFDLGFSYSTFQAAAVTAPGTSYSWDLANNANYADAWTSFLGTASLPGSNWAVFAGDNLGSGAGSRGLITTYASGSTMTQSQLATAMGNFDSYINANNVIGNHAAVSDGSSSTIAGNAFAESASAYGTTRKINNQGTLVVMNGFDQSMDVVSLQYVGTNQLANASMTTYANGLGNAKFNMASNGVLTFAAPVPEADSWAMLLAGLGLMGFIARRRTHA